MTLKYGQETDIYSFAWVLWAILFDGNWKAIMCVHEKNIMKGWIPNMKNFTEEAKELLYLCWMNEPKARPEIAYIVNSLQKLLPMPCDVADEFTSEAISIDMGAAEHSTDSSSSGLETV